MQNLKGGWAAKSLFDDAVSRYLNNIEQDVQLAKDVVKTSSGTGARTNISKYETFTGYVLPQGIAPDPAVGTSHIIQLDEVAQYYPVSSVSNYWLEKLCEHFKTSRRFLTNALNSFFLSDKKATHLSPNLFRTFSFPLIQQVLELPAMDIDISYVEDELAGVCWRRWHWNQTTQKPILFETQDKSGLSQSQWFVWRLIHDATHLVHMAHFPDAGNPLMPSWSMTMEAVAMYVEYKFLDLILDGYELPDNLATQVNLDSVKAILFMGLLERSLRLDYDLEVHLNRKPIDVWIEQTQKRTGIYTNGFYKFTTEFNGLPGFSAGYMIGCEAFKKSTDKIAILSNRQSLDFLHHKKEDRFSRSPLTDIPAKKPEHEIRIDSVGTIDAFSRSTLVNPFTNVDESINLDVSLLVSLNEHQRGIHMSRLQQAILRASKTNWVTLDELAWFLAKEAKLLQESNNAEAVVRTQILKPTFNPRSRTESSQPITITSKCEIVGRKTIRSIGLEVPVMTACPCTLAYSRLKTAESLAPFYEDANLAFVARNFPPTYTHSQPGVVKVQISSQTTLISINALYEAVASECHILESVLKRPDEHNLVSKAYERPQFCEDLCRSVANSVSSILSKGNELIVDVELDESIHPHKVKATLKAEASELWNLNT